MLHFGNKYADQMASNRSYGDGQFADKFYSAKVREFPGGVVEVVACLVPGMARKRRADSVGLAAPYRGPKEEPTVEELEALAKASKDRAIRRAKQAVRFHVKAIQADHMLTLSYRSADGMPMDDEAQLLADWDRFRRYVKKGVPACDSFPAHAGLDEWRFVACREKQENGTWHLHVALAGRQDINFLRRCWYLAIGGQQDDKGDATRGQVDVRGPSKRWGTKTAHWRPDKLSGYMTKYLHKAFDDIEQKGKKRYWAGRNNPKPNVMTFWLDAQTFPDAISETHKLFRFWCDRPSPLIWGNDALGVVWCSG